VRDGALIAVGATEPPPGRHAERVALDRAGDAARGATLYCTLEPCAPFGGKRTPACSDGISEAGIERVVVAIEDVDPRVAGAGIARLRARGVTVECGVGAKDAAEQLRPYLKHRTTGEPYVIAKFAASLDGRIATASGDSRWITGEAARDRVHRERARVDAIIVGSGTVLADDPALTARPGGVEAPRQPLRVVLDARGRTPPAASIFHQPGSTVVWSTPAAESTWRQAITAAGAELVVAEPGDDGGVHLAQLFQALGRRGVLTAWVEGGAGLLGSLFRDDLVDEVWAFLAPKIIGADGVPAIGGLGLGAISAAPVLRDLRVEPIGDDLLVRAHAGRWQPPGFE
jgi:diaminohydroxyphosphoribosylaminopyrimidine deaminase/5-amino-6-(5-phosphoribosylamino)uracil reductase